MRFFDHQWKVTIFPPSAAAVPSSASRVAPDLSPRAIDLGGAIEVTELDIKASIEKKLIKNPNTCELSIFNLPESDRALFKLRPITIKLEAGYDGTLKHLYFGDVRFSNSELTDDGVTWETKIHIKDGGRAFAGGFLTKAYKSGTPVLTIVRDAAAAMGLTIPPELEQVAALRGGIPRGFSADGPAQEELTRWLSPYDIGWSIQNGIIQTLREDQVREGEAFIVDEDSAALIGSPSYDVPQRENEKHRTKLNVKTLLWPEIQPGSRLEMRARAVRGPHKVVAVRHELDTAGETWDTSMEAVILSA